MKKSFRAVAATMAAVCGLALAPLTAHAASVDVLQDPDDCRVHVMGWDRPLSDVLTVKYSTGYTGSGASTEDYLWERAFPAPKLVRGQDEFYVQVYSAGKEVLREQVYVPDACLAPGLFPAEPTYEDATGRIGDAGDSPHADLWTIDPKGTLTYVPWSPALGKFYEERTVGGKMLNIASMTAITDKNGDRRADFLVRHKADASLWFYYNKGGGYLQAGKVVGKGWGKMDQIFYAGRMVAGSSTEYVLARRGTDGTLWRYQMTNTGLKNGTQVGSGWNSMRIMLSPGSMWGDGAWDVVGIRKDGGMHGYRASAGKLYGIGEIGHGWTNMTLASVPGDINLDGRLDLVGINSYGKIYGYTNTSKGFVSRGIMGETSNEDGYPIILA